LYYLLTSNNFRHITFLFYQNVLTISCSIV